MTPEKSIFLTRQASLKAKTSIARLLEVKLNSVLAF